MGSTYIEGLSMIIRYKLSIAEACAVIATVRYQSFRAQVADEKGIHEAWPSLSTILIIASKRRILSTIIATISVLQFVNVLSIQGSADVSIPTQFLGTIYFLYWFTNELELLVLRFSTTKLDSGYTSAVDVRPLWARPSSTSNLEFLRLYFALFGGCSHLVICIAVAMTVFQIGTSGLKVLGEPVSDTITMFCSMTVLVVPVWVFYACLWPVIFHYDEHEPAGKALHIWFISQSAQAAALILLFYCCIYDEQKTIKTSWTEWLP
ncbi:hypothetical protein SUNI508_11734 [Seiridium unicorne]|uniref:Uncharacterized protein n=1 Tax=Seiridium unicorne TaxID=138068 RepID=A0ABR2UGN6_9PEZI